MPSSASALDKRGDGAVDGAVAPTNDQQIDASGKFRPHHVRQTAGATHQPGGVDAHAGGAQERLGASEGVLAVAGPHSRDECNAARGTGGHHLVLDRIRDAVGST